MPLVAPLQVAAAEAFSSEVDTGSREENGIKQMLIAVPRFRIVELR